MKTINKQIWTVVTNYITSPPILFTDFKDAIFITLESIVEIWYYRAGTFDDLEKLRTVKTQETNNRSYVDGNEYANAVSVRNSQSGIK